MSEDHEGGHDRSGQAKPQIAVDADEVDHKCRDDEASTCCETAYHQPAFKPPRGCIGRLLGHPVRIRAQCGYLSTSIGAIVQRAK